MTSWPADARATMRILQVTTIVRDVQTAVMTAQSFTRAPVLVGRQYGNHLRLEAPIVSRRHGAFLFSKDGLQYIDYNSANGSFVDGVRIRPNVAIDLRSSSLITIAPFQIVAHLDLVDTRRLSNDPDAATPMIAVVPVSRATSGDDPVELARRATRVIEVLAERMLAAGSRTASTLTPLRLASTVDELVALLLEAPHADDRLAELRELLGELFRPRLSSVP